jgi:small subunit ribosomal protein S8
MMTDPITDMLNRIRNAQAVYKETVVIPHSNLKNGIAEILEKEGFALKAERKGHGVKKVIELRLKYLPGGENGGEKSVPAISGAKRISKPGQKIYSGGRTIKRVRDGYGISIISTSKGLITDKEARRQKIGGEVLCEIW